MRTRAWLQRGVTLIELVVSIVIISIALLGLMLVVSAVVSRSSDALIEHQASAIAQAYMEEIMLAGFCDPDFLSGTQTCRQQCAGPACTTAACGGTGALHEPSRALYDDVCDYAGVSDTGARDRNGNVVQGLGAYGVVVDVEDNGVSLGAPAINSNAGQVVRIDVSVSHPGMTAAVKLSAFRANTQ